MNEVAKKALLDIDFCTRYNAISEQFKQFNFRMKIVEKTTASSVFSSLGYNFIYQDKVFVHTEYWDTKIYSHTVFDIKNGVFIPYFNISINGSYIDLASGNLAFIYRTLIDDMNAPISAACFSSYDDLSKIGSLTLKIYEDFKTEYLKLSNLKYGI